MLWMKRIQAIVIVAIVASLLALVIVPMTGAFTEKRFFLVLFDDEIAINSEPVLKGYYQPLFQKDKKLEYLFLTSQGNSMLYEQISKEEPQLLSTDDFSGYVIIQTGSVWTQRAQALIEARQESELVNLREEYLVYMSNLLDSWQDKDRKILIGDLFNPLPPRTKAANQLDKWLQQTNEQLYKMAYDKGVLVAPVYESLRRSKYDEVFVEGKLNVTGREQVENALIKVLRITN